MIIIIRPSTPAEPYLPPDETVTGIVTGRTTPTQKASPPQGTTPSIKVTKTPKPFRGPSYVPVPRVSFMI